MSINKITAMMAMAQMLGDTYDTSGPAYTGYTPPLGRRLKRMQSKANPVAKAARKRQKSARRKNR